ncbi:MAG: transposase [Chloroflexi bacterium]|nr:transposase [Chloroflexota bacterium]
MHIGQAPLFDFEAFIRIESNDRLVIVLEALDAEKLLATLERERWTGRKGHSIRGMWSALIAGVLNQCHSLADVPRLLKRDKGTRTVCGFSKDKIPDEDACGRFLKKLVEHEELLEGCFCGLVERLRQLLPDFGAKLVVDSTDIQAYSNGHRKSPADRDARWGAKGAGHHGGPRADAEADKGEKKGKKRDLYWWFGYKLHLVVDAIYELPVSFVVTPANESDTKQMKPLLKKAVPDKPKAKPEAVIADKGYDSRDNYQLVFGPYGAAPIIPIRERDDMQQPDICNGKGTPTCSCGVNMVFWGRDGNYLKYRCPEAAGKGKCQSRFRCTASAYGYVLKLSIAEDPRRHPPVPRETKKWKRLSKLRTAVERVNSRVKGLLGLEHITVRGIAKVTVRSLLSLLAMVAIGVGMAQRQRWREVRTLVG